MLQVLGEVPVPLKKSSLRFDRREMIDRIALFTTKKLDPVSGGTVNFTTNAIIGLPLHFQYKSLSDIDLDRLQSRYTLHVDWDSFSGERFCKSIVLSDSAKAFVIAREVMMVKSHHIVGTAVLKSVFGFGTFFLWYFLEKGLALDRRLKAFGRMGVAGLVGGFGYIMYASVSDLYQCWVERGADRAAAKLGWSYAQGGREFYTQTLQRNKALRKLLEIEGERLFTLHGNERSMIRRRHLQLTERKTALEGYCKWYEEQAISKKDNAKEKVAAA